MLRTRQRLCIAQQVFVFSLAGYLLCGFLMWGSPTSPKPGFNGDAGFLLGLPTGTLIWVLQRWLRSVIGR